MVHLNSSVVESVALTKQEGKPEFLSDNILYFQYKSKGIFKEEDVSYGYVDLSTSRRKITPIQACEYPKLPIRPEQHVDEWLVGFGFWLVNIGSVLPDSIWRVVREGSNQIGETAAKLRVHDYYNAFQDIPRGSRKEWQIENILPTVTKIISQKQSQIDDQLDRKFTPMRELSDDDTSIVLGIFNFDGDQKSLVTALKSSWNVELKDSDVKIDKFLTKKITGIKSLEALIP